MPKIETTYKQPLLLREMEADRKWHKSRLAGLNFGSGVLFDYSRNPRLGYDCIRIVLEAGSWQQRL